MVLRTVRYLAMVLVIAAVLAGCGDQQAVESRSAPFPSPVPSDQPTVQPVATVFVPALFVDADLDLRAAPIDTPLTLQIPSLQVNAPVLGVGLTSERELS